LRMRDFCSGKKVKQVPSELIEFIVFTHQNLSVSIQYEIA